MALKRVGCSDCGGQMNLLAQRLLDQIEGIEHDTHAGQPPALELGEIGRPNADRLVGVHRGQRVTHQRRGLFVAEHDRFTVEAANADVVGDLPAYLHHRFLAAPGAEEWKHIDRSVDRPIDFVVEDGVELVHLTVVDSEMQRTRKTPETVLCHCADSKTEMQKNSKRPSGALFGAAPGCCIPTVDCWYTYECDSTIAIIALHKCRGMPVVARFRGKERRKSRRRYLGWNSEISSGLPLRPGLAIADGEEPQPDGSGQSANHRSDRHEGHEDQHAAVPFKAAGLKVIDPGKAGTDAKGRSAEQAKDKSNKNQQKHSHSRLSSDRAQVALGDWSRPGAKRSKASAYDEGLAPRVAASSEPAGADPLAAAACSLVSRT